MTQFLPWSSTSALSTQQATNYSLGAALRKQSGQARTGFLALWRAHAVFLKLPDDKKQVSGLHQVSTRSPSIKGLRLTLSRQPLLQAPGPLPQATHKRRPRRRADQRALRLRSQADDRRALCEAAQLAGPLIPRQASPPKPNKCCTCAPCTGLAVFFLAAPTLQP